MTSQWKNKVLLLLFLFITYTCHSQIPSITDSSDQRIKNLERSINEINFNLKRSHYVHTKGVILMLVGLGAIPLFAINDRTALPFAIGASAVFVLGFGITLDSHKWIARGINYFPPHPLPTVISKEDP